jgi:hypothetical protein
MTGPLQKYSTEAVFGQKLCGDTTARSSHFAEQQSLEITRNNIHN